MLERIEYSLWMERESVLWRDIANTKERAHIFGGEDHKLNMNQKERNPSWEIKKKIRKNAIFEKTNLIFIYCCQET